MAKANLKRTFGLGALFVYGLGDILGAGIYALVGKIASEAGTYSWVSFSVALGIALLTALSYAELTRRHPHSGGASYFMQKASDRKSFAFLAGWLLLCVSIVSMATLSRAFVGYVQGFGPDLPAPLIIAVFLGILCLINLWGIEQSSLTNMISTSIEVVGLLTVVAAGFYFLGEAHPSVVPQELPFSSIGILQGAALAFYAFIGFEDLANVAEEVKNPERNLPIAIIGSLVVAGTFYVVIGWISTAVLDPGILASSPNPLTEIVAKSGIGFPLHIFGVIALFAVANTCLLNFITASRLLYGMSGEGLIPKAFEKVHDRFKTPHVAILSLLPIAFLLAVMGNLKFLAGTTSVLILLVFCSTNFSLTRIKKKEARGRGFTVPAFVPWLALASNLMLISFSNWWSLSAAGGFLLGGGLVFVLLQRRK